MLDVRQAARSGFFAPRPTSLKDDPGWLREVVQTTVSMLPAQIELAPAPGSDTIRFRRKKSSDADTYALSYLPDPGALPDSVSPHYRMIGYADFLPAAPPPWQTGFTDAARSDQTAATTGRLLEVARWSVNWLRRRPEPSSPAELLDGFSEVMETRRLLAAPYLLAVDNSHLSSLIELSNSWSGTLSEFVEVAAALEG